MLFAASGLIGCPVEARDGRIGLLADLLVDDRDWTVRWLVVDPGDWLPGGKALVPPSAVAPIRFPPKPAFPMLSFGETLAVPVDLNRAQVVARPADEPATGDFARLGGAAALKGFSVHAADGATGTVEQVFLDDARWSVRFLVVATPGWLAGRLVQVPVAAVAGVDWPGRQVTLDVAREKVDSAPAFDPLAVLADDLAEASLRDHFRAPDRGA